MENVSVAANVVMTTKRADYEDFVNRLDKIVNEDQPIKRLSELRQHYRNEIEFIEECGY